MCMSMGSSQQVTPSGYTMDANGKVTTGAEIAAERRKTFLGQNMVRDERTLLGDYGAADGGNGSVGGSPGSDGSGGGSAAGNW